MHKHKIWETSLVLAVIVSLLPLSTAGAGHGPGYGVMENLPNSLTLAHQYIWHTFYGGSDLDLGEAIAIDGSGNIYIAGVSITTWNGPDGESPLHAYTGEESDIAVIALDSTGAYRWHTFYGSSDDDSAGSIAVDESGNVYVTGDSYATWDGDDATAPLHAYTGGDDIAVLALDSVGGYLWHTFYGSSDDDLGYGIALDGSGNVYVAGNSIGTWDGPGPTAPLHAYTGGGDIAVLALDSSGAYRWHTFYGSSADDYGYDIALDGSGDIYVAGESSATWDGAGTTAPLHAYTGGYDITVLALDSAGAYRWHTMYGSNGSDDGYAIALDESDNVYVAGTSYATWDGDSSTAPLHAYTGGGDITVLALDSAGAYRWHTMYGSNGSDDGYAIALDESDNVYVAGTSYATWNGDGPTAPLHGYVGNGDIAALALDSTGGYHWHTFYGSSESDFGSAITLDGSGNIYVAGSSYATWDGDASTAPLHAHTQADDFVVLAMGNASPEIDMQGSGQSISDGDDTPTLTDDTDFGRVNVGSTPVTHTFSINNNGNIDLTLTGSPAVTLTHDTHFSVITQPLSTTLAGGQTTTFAIAFAPLAEGSFTDTVTIANNDGDENPYTFVIAGATSQRGIYLPLVMRSKIP